MSDVRSEVLTAPVEPKQGERALRRPHGGKLVSLAVSGALLVAVYRNMDVRLIGEVLLRADRTWLVISIGMILPITVLRAIRFFWVAPAGALPGVVEALRLTLVASALNLFLPAKTGDLVKSYFVATRSQTSAGVSVAIVVYERLCDLLGLITWCLVGWLVGRPQATGLPATFWWLLGFIGTVCAVLISSERVAAALRFVAVQVFRHRKLRPLRSLAEGWPDLLQVLRGRRRWIGLFSLLLWLGHLFQIWLFTIPLGVEIPFTVCASLAAIVLMAGQLPFTFAGLGTRDLAAVALLSAFMPPESAAAMGVLIATRNFLPPLVGAPMMRPYLSTVVVDARRWRLRMKLQQDGPPART